MKQHPQSVSPFARVCHFEWFRTCRPSFAHRVDAHLGKDAQFSGVFFCRHLPRLAFLAVVWGVAATVASCADDDSGGNSPPIALAGDDQVGAVGLEVRLDGASSYDPDADPLTFAWSFVLLPDGSQANLQSADTANATFLPDVAGAYEVQLVVSDGLVESVPDSVKIQVSDSPSSDVWSATYGLGGDEEMEGIAVTPDGGVLVCGLTSSYSGDDSTDALLVLLSRDGQVEWARTYGGAADDMAIDVKVASDGSIWLAGWTQSFGGGGYDAWVLKLNALGDVQWAQAYGGTGDEQAWSIALTSDGGAVFAGGTTSFGAGLADYWVVRLDGSGSVVWQRAYGGAEQDAPGAPYDEYVARVVVAADGTIAVSSMSFSFGQGGDIWVLSLDPADGSVLWEEVLGGPDEDSNWAISAFPDGGLLVAGSTVLDPDNWDADLWVIRLETDGTVAWQRRYGLAGLFDEALGQIPTSDGGALIIAYAEHVPDTDWRTILLKLEADGTLSWAREYDPGAVSWANAAVEVSGGFVAVGVSAQDAQTWEEQMWVWKMDARGGLGQSCDLGVPFSPVVADTSFSPQPTHADVTDTDAAAAATDVVVQDVSLTAAFNCR